MRHHPPQCPYAERSGRSNDVPIGSRFLVVLGTNPEIAVDLFPITLESDDLLLLCSDGLYPMVTHQDLVSTLVQYDIAEACTVLTAMANDNGGSDNITVVIAKIP